VGSREPSGRWYGRWHSVAPDAWCLRISSEHRCFVHKRMQGYLANGQRYATLVEAQLAAEDHARHQLHEALRALGEPMSGNRTFWTIDVHTWGKLFCFGTEAEAEKWRVHKARWEASVARKSPSGPGEGAACLRCISGPLLDDCPGCNERDEALRALGDTSHE